MTEHADPSSYMIQPLQWGGIRTGTLDHPQPLGGERSRVALIDTGAGLDVTVAIDRGGDVIDARYRGQSLTYLSRTGLMPGRFADHREMDWLQGWPGGLITTCGPLHIGAPNRNRPYAEGLHGHQSHLRAAVLSVVNPDLATADRAFSLTLRLDDARMFGPNVEVLRQISGEVGRAALILQDTVTNCGNTSVPHHQLYHVNFGYPLLCPGSRLVLSGRPVARWGTFESVESLSDFCEISGVLDAHAGAGEGGAVLVEVGDAAADDVCVGVIHASGEYGVSLRYDRREMEKLAVWQHLGRGIYVCGLEPFHGSLVDGDRLPGEPEPMLEPGASRRYRLEVCAGHGQAFVDALRSQGHRFA